MLNLIIIPQPFPGEIWPINVEIEGMYTFTLGKLHVVHVGSEAFLTFPWNW